MELNRRRRNKRDGGQGCERKKEWDVTDSQADERRRGLYYYTTSTRLDCGYAIFFFCMYILNRLRIEVEVGIKRKREQKMNDKREEKDKKRLNKIREKNGHNSAPRL